MSLKNYRSMAYTVCHAPIPMASGWSDGEMVLDKLPVSGCSTNLDYSMTRAYCTCSGCEWGCFGHFFSQLSLLLFGRRPNIDRITAVKDR